jgi:hypothetical protein
MERLDEAVREVVASGDHDLALVVSAEQLRDVIRLVQQNRRPEALTLLSQLQMQAPTLDDVYHGAQLPPRVVHTICRRCGTERGPEPEQQSQPPKPRAAPMSKQEKRERVLDALSKFSGLKTSELGTAAGITNLGATLTEMEREGLIVNDAKPGDYGKSWRLAS